MNRLNLKKELPDWFNFLAILTIVLCFLVLLSSAPRGCEHSDELVYWLYGTVVILLVLCAALHGSDEYIPYLAKADEFREAVLRGHLERIRKHQLYIRIAFLFYLALTILCAILAGLNVAERGRLGL
jgi:hypothetical protein